MSTTPQFAVYAEHSDTTKPMAPGMNVRVFNRTEAQQGQSIRLDCSTGVISLAAGLYHITGTSVVSYYDPLAPDQALSPMRPEAAGGYCRLRYADDPDCPNERAISIGTISNADMLPSTIEIYLTVVDDVGIVMEHQAGSNVDGIYLQVQAGDSPWHVFARIAIRRL